MRQSSLGPRRLSGQTRDDSRSQRGPTAPATASLLAWRQAILASALWTALLSAGHAEDAGTRFLPAQPAPKLDQQFHSTHEWIGADGGHSVLLDRQRRLWLFSDTWVGQIRDGRRVDATIVNNTVALQQVDDDGSPRFLVARDEHGKPTAFVEPVDGRGWFWTHDGVVVGGKLYFVLSQIEHTGEPGVFGFRQVGQTLAVVDNPGEDPTRWNLRQHAMPCALFSPQRAIAYGASLLVQDDWLYLFGTDEDIAPGKLDRYLVVARAPLDAIEDFGEWQYFGADGWTDNWQAAKRLVPHMGSECSVCHLPAANRYVLVYTDGGLSDRIQVCTAKGITGPWSSPQTVYRCPEVQWDRRIFCYGAKAHPSLAADDELVISYFANSRELGHVARDTRLYFPRFVRAKLDR